jgi:hypothetical protein
LSLFKKKHLYQTLFHLKSKMKLTKILCNLKLKLFSFVKEHIRFVWWALGNFNLNRMKLTWMMEHA